MAILLNLVKSTFDICFSNVSRGNAPPQILSSLILALISVSLMYRKKMHHHEFYLV